MLKWHRLFILATLFVSAVPFAVASTAGIVLANGSCPASGTGNPQADPQLSASYSISGSTATYQLISKADESSSGGVPGLIEYCIYPAGSALPTTISPQATGADGSAWGSS
jgi:hypothetical protein